jgi:lipopolysaccharide export LptBFGC system permease protein LptF
MGVAKYLIAGFLPALAYLIIADFFEKTRKSLICIRYRFFLALFKM